MRKIALLVAFAASLFGTEPSYEVIETIKKGADKSAKNNERLSAADVAKLTGNGDIIDFLRADFMK